MDVSNLLVEVFIKVMNGLVMTLEEDEIFMCLAVLLPIREWSRMPRYRSSPTS